MAEFYTFPHHEVLEELRDSRKGSPQKPFSTTHLEVPVMAVLEALKTLTTHLIHDRKDTGITEDELAALRSMRQKLVNLHGADQVLRTKQDLILRCLHPDGCYRPYLKKETLLEAYDIAQIEPVAGVNGLPLGYPSDLLDALFEFLEKEVKELEQKHFRL